MFYYRPVFVGSYNAAGLGAVPVTASFDPSQLQEILTRIGALQQQAAQLNTTLGALQQQAAQQGPQAIAAAQRGAQGVGDVGRSLGTIGQALPGFSGAVGSVGSGLQLGAGAAEHGLVTAQKAVAVLTGLSVAGIAAGAVYYFAKNR